MKDSEKLNRLYGDFLKFKTNPINIDIGHPHPVTLARGDQDAFSLNAAISGSVQTIINVVETEAHQGVIRAFIPFQYVARMVTDDNFAYMYLGVMKNNMLLELSKFFDLDKRTVVWNSPGKPNVFFREFENMPGVEVRAYIDKTPVVKE